MRRFAALLLALLLLPLAAGQTRTRPIEGDYTDVYMIAGRVVDLHGMPFAEARVQIAITAKGYNVPVQQAGTNCRGEFVSYFELPSVPPGARVKVDALGPTGTSHGTAGALLDPFFRRTDLDLKLDGLYDHRCASLEGTWNNTISVRGRVLNKTVPYKDGNHTFEARPYGGIIRMRYTFPDGVVTCPPESTGGEICHLFITDERGDVKYTWVFDKDVPAAGNASILLIDNSTFTEDVHPLTRQAVFFIEGTGQGAPPIPQETPFVGVASLALALAVALALPRRR